MTDDNNTRIEQLKAELEKLKDQLWYCATSDRLELAAMIDDLILEIAHIRERNGLDPKTSPPA